MAEDEYEWRRFPTQAEADAAFPDPSPTDPVAVGMLFCHALEDPARYREALLNLTTPESQVSWGDFTEASRAYLDIEEAGFGNVATEAVGDPDVRYLKVMRGVTETYQALDEQILSVGAIVTLVWRPAYGQWMVHGIGHYIRPEDVPH